MTFLGMAPNAILAQILSLICIAIIAFAKKSRTIHIANVMYNVFCVINGLIQHTYSMCTSSLVIIYRSSSLIFKDKLKPTCKWFPLTFISLHIITGYLSYKEPTDILSIIAPILTGCVYWFFDSLQIYRLNDIFTNILWTIYNIKFKAYILALVSIYTIVVSFAALIRNHFKGIR